MMLAIVMSSGLASERIERAPKSLWVDAVVRPCSAYRRDPRGLARSHWNMKVDRD